MLIISKFSIITVCLNCSSTIERTIQSISSQIYTNFEWIVIDGDSKDGTVKILRKYQDNISTFVSEQDSGIYEAMNKGIRLASGEYIIFMNAGDTFYDKNTLEIVSQYLGPDMIYGETVKKSSDTQLVCSYPSFLTKKYFMNYTLCHQSTYYKRTTLDKLGGFDVSYKIAGDYELYAKLIHEKDFTYQYISKPLSIFQLDGISNCPRNRDILKLEQHIIRSKYFKSYKKSYKYFKYKIRCFYKAFLQKSGSIKASNYTKI